MGKKELLHKNVPSTYLSIIQHEGPENACNPEFFLFLLHLMPELASKTLILSSKMDWLPI